MAHKKICKDPRHAYDKHCWAEDCPICKAECDPKYWFEGLCPICGEAINLSGKTTDGRLIGSCNDAFTKEQWEAKDE